MANIKISELTAAASALTTQEFEVNEGGSSKKVTGQQILNLVDANLGTIAQQDSSSVTITGGSISGITDLAIADGGTGASTAQAARNNLLPVQTGNATKFLTTDGTDVSWAVTGVTDGDKGDITVTSSGTVWSIDTGAVTTTKILDANVTTAKLSTTGVTAGTYGSTSQIPVITVDNKGRLSNVGTENLVISGTLIGYTVYTSSTTWSKSTNNPSFVIVEVQGPGGAGSAGTTVVKSTVAGAGGGGGGYARKRINAASLASSESVTISTACSFGAHASASAGGVGATAGGVGSGGDLNVPGERGSGQIGGGSFYGAGGSGGSGAGGAGRLYGGGGSGGSPGSGNEGAAGAAGVVIVWEYR
jgi:hypothetical protein